MSKISYKFRIYPSKAQATKLEATLDICRELYNAGLQERRDAWKLNRKNVSNQEQEKQLPEIKKIREDLNGVHSQVLQDVLKRLDRSFQNFFRRAKAGARAGFPRFQGKHRYNSFTYKQLGFSINSDKLTLSKIGKIKIKQHRTMYGKVKTLTVSRTRTGKWFACFSVETTDEILEATGKAVGVDVGISTFATLSTGEQIDNPRFIKADEKALAKAQRRKKRQVAAHIHERIKNRRSNFAHQESRKLVNRFDAIFFESLNIKGMMKNHCLAKSIADAAWNQTIQLTSYKAENAGRIVRTVNPRNTSQLCSRCGELVKKELSCRVHHCLNCGLVLDRDHNAALNILALGLKSIGTQSVEAPAFMRGE